MNYNISVKYFATICIYVRNICRGEYYPNTAENLIIGCSECPKPFTTDAYF